MKVNNKTIMENNGKTIVNKLLKKGIRWIIDRKFLSEKRDGTQTL